MGRFLGLLKSFHGSPIWILVEIGLAFLAVSSLIDARQQAASLTYIHESLTTKGIGTFPSYLPDITKLITKARTSVEIWVDVIGYGKFSATDEFRKYQRALEDQGAKVTIHHYAADTVLHNRLRQFRPDDPALYLRDGPYPTGKPDSYNTSFSKFEREDRFQRYMDTLQIAKEEAPTEWKSFFDLLQRQDLDLVRRLKEAKVRVIPDYSRDSRVQPIFIWMIDRVEAGDLVSGEAIFSIAGEGAKEIAFLTSDPKLLFALSTIVDPPTAP